MNILSRVFKLGRIASVNGLRGNYFWIPGAFRPLQLVSSLKQKTADMKQINHLIKQVTQKKKNVIETEH